MIHHGNEIADALLKNWTEVRNSIEQLTPEQFSNSPEGKWSPGQHLEHLLRSAKPLRKALAYPKFVIRLVAGKPNRDSRSFEGVKERYYGKLSKGGAASGRFVPPPVPYSQKEKLLAEYMREGVRMAANIRKRWSEKNLDNYLLPHPLLGKVTVREMMFFTVFHTTHHDKIIHRDLES